jgi:hypothetical protein
MHPSGADPCREMSAPLREEEQPAEDAGRVSQLL